MIRARDLVVRFGRVTALRLAALDLAEGERLGVTGPNGSGKSTLLRVLAGLLPPTEGTVTGLPPPGRTVLVHQRPWMLRGTARANVAYALRLHGRPAREAEGWLDLLAARGVADRDAKALSGGERRRVAVARALACGPEVLLLDEPFAELDEAGAGTLRGALADFRGTLVVAAPGHAGVAVARAVELGPAG